MRQLWCRWYVTLLSVCLTEHQLSCGTVTGAAFCSALIAACRGSPPHARRSALYLYKGGVVRVADEQRWTIKAPGPRLQKHLFFFAAGLPPARVAFYSDEAAGGASFI